MSQRHQASWSDEVIAEKAVEWEDGPEGRAVLLVPRFRKGIFAKWLQPRLSRPFIKVKLDELGTFAWRRIDGRKTFAEIANEMEKELGDKCKPAKERLKQFYITLYRSNFIKLYTQK